MLIVFSSDPRQRQKLIKKLPRIYGQPNRQWHQSDHFSKFLALKNMHEKIYISRFFCFSIPRNRFGTKIRLVTQFDFSISETNFYSKNREIEEIRSCNF